MKAAEVVGIVRISNVAGALGCGDPRRGRIAAPWRDTKDRNVSLDDAKGVYFDFVEARGGGVLDFVGRVLNCSRADALSWLASCAGVELDAAGLSREEKRAWRESSHVAEEVGFWFRARCAELETTKAKAFEAWNVATLAWSSRELWRLQSASPDALVAAFLADRESDPDTCADRVRWGREDLAFSEAVAEFVVSVLALEQEARHAA